MSLELYKASARDLLSDEINPGAIEVFAELLKNSVKLFAKRGGDSGMKGPRTRSPVGASSSSSETAPPQPTAAELTAQIERLNSVIDMRIEDESEDKYYLSDQLVLLNSMVLRLKRMGAGNADPVINASLTRLSGKIGELKGQLINRILEDDD